MKLSELVQSAGATDARFDAYKASVSNAAEVAIGEINGARNMEEMKSALTNFFNSIK